MMARLTVTVLAFAIGVVAVFAQLDQQSRLSPDLAALVPDALSGNAARERSKIASATGLADVALEEARRQVRLRPMPAESLTRLALAGIGAEDENLARAALEAASRRGWREPLAQLASAEAALQQGEHDIAARRIAALLATGNLPEPAHALLARLIRTPDGRQAFAERLAAKGRWQDSALLPAALATDPMPWADTVASALAQGASLGCPDLRQLAGYYRNQGQEAAAARFWPGACPAG